ncbi:Sel1 repeat-containing protein [Sphingomonas gellani]|uniref:Sel1 repeat-containing protein n=1 Tax=Sphingomonas gellani TaxID=1166340 RepID=A0A1H7Y6C5_9SPHN|nr:SPOR domain-containing protein [Sphingomonas gellani]SEM41553.1 Sel1 repeat-containing protein [Sphingomonas gellani]
MMSALTGVLLTLATAAGADVKAGWDAWQRGDYRAAVEEWRAPAVAGDADAQFNLGQAYKLGRGVPVDPALAESWFRKAALQKHPLAEDNYGLALYQSGRKTDAVPWLEKSIARGEPRAELVLGTMLFNGDGVARDVPRAYALMTLASQSGLKSASETLAQMDGYVSPADRQKGTALVTSIAAQQQPAKVAPDGRMLVDATPARPSTPSPAPAPAKASTPPAPTPSRTATPTVQPTKVAAVKAESTAPAKAKPVTKPTPAKEQKPAAKPERPGRYRVQLGAFRDEGNARALWARVGKRIGGSPSYAKSGGLTRLVGGAFASEADAQRACRSAGVTCVVVR